MTIHHWHTVRSFIKCRQARISSLSQTIYNVCHRADTWQAYSLLRRLRCVSLLYLQASFVSLTAIYLNFTSKSFTFDTFSTIMFVITLLCYQCCFRRCFSAPFTYYFLHVTWHDASLVVFFFPPFFFVRQAFRTIEIWQNPHTRKRDTSRCERFQSLRVPDGVGFTIRTVSAL